MMKINPNWNEHHGGMLKVVAVVVVAFLLLATFLKQCTQVGKEAGKDVSVPSADKGFIMKTNLLLAHLVQQGVVDEKHPPHSIEELQKCYPAFQFALPYHNDVADGARAADIRLVGINPEKIEDEDDRLFYFNSDIPSLLEKQRKNLSERMFIIRFNSVSHLKIKSVEIIPGMFKVALKKTPWTGTIRCADNSLFSEDEHCYLTWGKSVVPIRMSEKGHLQAGGHQTVVTADEPSRLLLRQQKQLDYYSLYEEYQNDNTTLCVRFPGDSTRAVYIDYLKDGQVALKTVGCWCQVYQAEGASQHIAPSSASTSPALFPLDNTMKLMVTRQKGAQLIGELVVTRHNPMRILSMLTRSNKGLSRYQIAPELTDRFTQQVVSGLSATFTNSMEEKDVTLSIDPLLSMVMEKELRQYGRQLAAKSGFHKNDQWELSLTVMDMATGAIVAVPYYRSTDQGIDDRMAIARKNPALIRRFVGSSFKPLVALAAVLTNPRLAHLSTIGQYHLTKVAANDKEKSKAVFYDHETTAWADKGSAQGFWKGCPDMATFFHISDDVYPVALVAKALHFGSRQGNPFTPDAWRREVYIGNKPDFTWAQSEFVVMLDRLYNIPGPKAYMENDSLRMEYYTWDQLQVDSTDRFRLDNVSPDATLFNYDRFAYKGATLHNELSTWVLGQGTNEWNCLKLAEAWTRMLTKRAVKASLLLPSQETTFANLCPEGKDSTWNYVLDALRKAQSMDIKKLLPPMNKAVEKLNEEEQISDRLVLLGKTGTPDNYERIEYMSLNGGRRWLDVGLYCMGLMPESSYRSVKANQGGSGLMCVMRVTRITSVNPGKTNGIQSTDARDFFLTGDNRLQKLYRLTQPYLKGKAMKKKDQKKTTKQQKK